MTLSLADVDFLLSSEASQLLADLVDQDLSNLHMLSILTRLRRTVSSEQAAALLLTARLRQKAVSKFGADAAKMLFTPDALEQASDPLIRRYRAAQASGITALDICCGIGTDSFALAETGKDVLGLDLDVVRLTIARYNAAVLGLSVRFEERDVTRPLPDIADTLFYDPARRDDMGRRIFGVEAYEPPLSLIKGWNAPLKAVKLAPGVDLMELHEYGGGIEFLSVEGDLKEAVLWLGAGWRGTKATLFADGHIYHWQRQGAEPEVGTVAPRAYVCEPDPSILRAGLVQDVAAAINGTMLDSTIAYLCTDTLPVSPWVRTWRVRDWMPFNLKKLRAHLREGDIGRVTVKKRGFPMSPEELQAALKLKGKAACTLVCTRFNGDPIVMICDEMPVKPS
jgi:SAM-dependent methyltransferase